MRSPGDIFTEPSNIDVNTLKNLGPLTDMAGLWEGAVASTFPRSRCPHRCDRPL